MFGDKKVHYPQGESCWEEDKHMFGTERVYNTMKMELETYMDYDDWNLAQNLIVNRCDPFAYKPVLSKSFLMIETINVGAYCDDDWKLPDDRNLRWGNYRCRNFTCLSSKNPKRGYTQCIGCFEMEKEIGKWVTNSTLLADFKIDDVLRVKAGEIRIGLDIGVGTGTFAARMREKNVTVVTTALNLGAPFSEMIALRGLIPMYISLNQRLPFFDNTMDMIHTAGLMDGWIDLLLMDFMLYDWDRVLRPGGLLWIDRFFCNKKDLDDYMYMFLQFRYKKHKCAISPKSKDEVYLSALLEKPHRAI
ncbi:hypothetical protein Bca52824_085291 [Brassica carinata]|uniref:Uncharacterized protein n=1 Tax=Brassica carinata TaxID=52824 RepID=A0A8X7P7W8_BRACI|nr:hypothetical protein Bca52824_085291 [Brassica carinata]